MSRHKRRSAPEWAFEDEQWLRLDDWRLDASVRMIGANRLHVPDSCLHEAESVLRCVFGASDPDALGGRRAVRVLYSLLRQFGSEDHSVPIIVKAIRRPVTVLFSTGSQEYLVAPKEKPRLLRGDRPQLLLYHSSWQPMFIPQELRIRGQGSIATVELREWATKITDGPGSAARRRGERQAYAGNQRSICTEPETYRALCAGRPVPYAASGPSINVIRLSRRTGVGNYDSTRFGINFSRSGQWVTGLWSKCSDFTEFLDVYSPTFKAFVTPLMTADQ